jgi:transglutaminase-like putative cysteine protease
MRIKIEVDLHYKVLTPGPAILAVEAAGAFGQNISNASIDFGQVEHFARVPGEEGIGEKIIIRTADDLRCRYTADVVVTRPRPVLERMSALEVDEMSGDALRYLLPSRYCQAERFVPFVGQRFGDHDGGAKVLAIREWIEQRLDYVSGSSDANTTAADTFIDRRGVCRDYAHLMVAMCRAAQIPARIASVFAPRVDPPDFHAVAEVHLDGAWHLIDPTGMASADEMALIAVGRDAVDVAFLTTFTGTELLTQTVKVTEAR